MNFCRRCGAKLHQQSEKVYSCENGHTIFANSIPTVGIFFVTDDNQVIFSVRGIDPHKGMLDSFGGFLDLEETLEYAAVRELIEETGLNPGDYEPLQYLSSANGHYPYENEPLPVITIFYWTRLKPGKQPNPQDDSAEAKTIPLFEVDMAELHDDDIREGIKALQRLFSDKSL